MPGDESKPRDEDDAHERAEFERASEELERSLRIKPSRLVATPEPSPVMSKISFPGYPLIWLGEEETVYVNFRVGDGLLGKPLDVSWKSLDESVLAIREVTRAGSASGARLAAVGQGETKIVATTREGHREELQIRVADRDAIEIPPF